MGNSQFYLRPCLFFLKSNIVPCLVHAYFFLKSNIAMLIFGVGKIDLFYFFQRKKVIFHVQKTKLIQNLKFDKEKTQIKRDFSSFLGKLGLFSEKI